MDAEMFNELLESVRQGKDILKGERTASRRFYVNEINVSQLRSRFELTQNKFAQMLGISVTSRSRIGDNKLLTPLTRMESIGQLPFLRDCHILIFPRIR